MAERKDTVEMPLFISVVTAVMVALVTLKAPALFAVPTMVISAPCTGALPDRIWNTTVPVTPVPLSEMTFPRVGPVLLLYEPST